MLSMLCTCPAHAQPFNQPVKNINFLIRLKYLYAELGNLTGILSSLLKWKALV
jgi:hypothetical protein